MKIFNSAIFLVFITITACESEDSEPSKATDLAELPEITVNRTLEISESEEFRPGIINALEVDSRGNIMVGDRQQNTITIFDDQGNYLQTLGRVGSGPGEFRDLMSVSLNPDSDTLFSYDSDQKRITRFLPDEEGIWKYESTIKMNGELSYAISNLLPLRDGKLVIKPMDTSYMLHHEDAEDLPLLLFSDGGQILNDELIRIPFADIKVERITGGMRSFTIPFGRSVIVRQGSGDYIYHAWNDQPKINKTDIDGQTSEVTNFPVSNPLVTAGESDEILDSPMRQNLSASDIPGTKPALNNFLVDEANRIWANINTEAEEEYNWILFNKNGDPEGGFNLPPEFRFSSVRNGKLYGYQQAGGNSLIIAGYSVDL